MRLSINLDMRALCGVYLGVIMGRDAGFLTAASAIAQKYPGDGPHLIYLPERPFEIERFLMDVKGVYERYGCCIAAVSEGIRNEKGQMISLQLMKHIDQDAHGNITLSGTGALGDALADEIKLRLGIKRVRADTFGYLQRAFFGCVSDVDQHEAREVGERAVQFAVWGDQDGSVAIRRTGEYSVDYRLVPLADVAGRARCMPDDFIHADANHVTEKFRYYLRPLLGSGLQSPTLLRAPQVPKLLQKVQQ